MAMCSSYGGGKYVPPHMRTKGGTKGGVSGLTDYPQDGGNQGMMVPWNPNGQMQNPQMPQVGPTQNPQMPPATQNAADWARNGPWMNTGAKTVDSLQQSGTQPAPPWKMKIIYSITKAQKQYEPQYSAEETQETEEEDLSWSVPVTVGRRRKCKTGRFPVVKAKERLLSGCIV